MRGLITSFFCNKHKHRVANVYKKFLVWRPIEDKHFIDFYLPRV